MFGFDSSAMTDMRERPHNPAEAKEEIEGETLSRVSSWLAAISHTEW